MKPVINPDFHGVLLSENAWISDYFPELPVSSRPDVVRGEPRGIFSPVVDALDYLCRSLSIVYMRILGHPVEDVVVERNRIQFFDRNSWPEKRRVWKDRLEFDDVG